MLKTRNTIMRLDKNKQTKGVSPEVKAMVNQVFKEDHGLIDALKYL